MAKSVQKAQPIGQKEDIQKSLTVGAYLFSCQDNVREDSYVAMKNPSSPPESKCSLPGLIRVMSSPLSCGT